MEGAVAHEVADELCEFRRHPPRDARPKVGGPVEVAERRKRDLLGLTDKAVEHERHAIVLLDLGKSSPDPVTLGVDNLDPVRRRPLDPVAAARLYRDDLLEAVDVELRRLSRPVVRRDFHIEGLPLGAYRIANRAEPDEAVAPAAEAVAG